MFDILAIPAFCSDPVWRPAGLMNVDLRPMAADGAGILWTAVAEHQQDTSISILQSTNAGCSWTTVTREFPSQVLRQKGHLSFLYSLAVAPDHSLWAATSLGAYRLKPGANDFTTSSLTGIRLCNIQVLRDGNLYASGQMGIYRSADGGEEWSLLSPGVPMIYSYLGTGLQENGVLWAIGENIYRSKDDGVTWEKNAFLEESSDIILGCIVFPDDGSILVGFGGFLGGRILRSENGGDSWQIVSPKGITDLILTRDYGIVAANGQDQTRGFSRSLDNGRTWSLFNSGLTNAPNHFVGGRFLTELPDGRIYARFCYGQSLYNKSGVYCLSSPSAARMWELY